MIKFLSLHATYHYMCADIDGETIRRHDEWFQEYTNLKNMRKMAIDNWRKEKHEDGHSN